jgi:hypothetical protein
MRFRDLVNGFANFAKINPCLVKGIVHRDGCLDSGE